MRTLVNFFKQPVIISSLVIYFISILTGVFLSSEVEFSFHNDDLSSNPLYYFLHNLKSSFILMSGLALFSLTTLWSLFLNGVMLGATFTGVTIEKSLEEAIISIFFHGIFEIPAIILSGAIGLYPGYILYIFLRNKERISFKEHAEKIIIMFLLIIPLFFTAGVMEAKVSPFMISYFFG